MFHEWDSKGAAVEKYDARGHHLGEFDPVTGRQLKPRDPDGSGGAMTIRHYLPGFDKATGALRQEWPIPPDCEPAVACILRDNADRLAVIAPGELAPRRAERVGAAIGHRIDPGIYDYFVQAFDESSKDTTRQSAAAE